MQHYTLPQINVFAAAIAAEDQEMLRQRAIAARSAQAQQRDFDKFMRKLDGQED